MSNVRPATVIVFDGLRARFRSSLKPPPRHLYIPIYRPQFSSASQLLSRAYSTAAVELLGPQDAAVDLKSRTLRWPPTPSKDEEVEHVVAMAEPARLYELLRIEASHGDFHRVQVYAETLIRKHREKPNLRMYSALILANSNAYGSVASVKDYVRQLRDDGLDLDLGTCHDIIKVGSADLVSGKRLLTLPLQVLAVHPDYIFRAEILSYMQARWLQLSDVGRHDLVAGLIRETSFEMALDEMEHMKSEGIRIQPWLYDMIIYALAEQAEFDEVLRILKDRIGDGNANISGALWTYLLDVGSEAMHVGSNLETSYRTLY
jgi:hypothetical protein